MSKDSSATYIHMHSPRLADLFEDFCTPPSSTNTNTASGSNANTSGGTSSNNVAGAASGDNANLTQLPGHFLPFEEIHLPPHLMPLNPEDEDDVVPDMHAAFGINRALGQGGQAGGGEGGGGVQREPAWRDLGLQRLVDGVTVPRGGAPARPSGARREGKIGGGLLLMR